MTRRSATTTTMVAVLIAALALLCLGGLVEAAAPTMDATPCASWLCDEQTGCRPAPAKPLALSGAALVVPLMLAPPAATASLPDVAVRPPLRDRQVTPLAPRSPPVA
jgi:hypothetical protein